MKSKITKAQADKAYHAGRPLMTDAEYDRTFGINADSAALPDDSKWERIRHTVPVSSLNKIEVIDSETNKAYFDNLEAWVEKIGGDNFVCTLKYDGGSLYVYLKKGVLKRAVTRGRNGIGEDVKRNFLKAKNSFDKTSSPNIECISGEMMLRKSIFQKSLSVAAIGEEKGYDNSRNGCVGALRDYAGRNARHLEFFPHGIVGGDFETEGDKFHYLNLLYDNIEYEKVKGFKGIVNYYYKVLAKRDELDVEIDGIVVCVASVKKQNKLGYDPSGNPKFRIALKFPYPRAKSKIKKIVYQLGLTGTITPVAIIKPVYLGATVKRASLANFDEIERLWGKDKPRIGDLIEVSRRNDVIPKIEKVLKKRGGAVIRFPSKCPVCKGEVYRDGPMINCSSESCESKALGNLYKYASKIKDAFDVKGLGVERVYQMYQAGLVKTPDQLYEVTAKQLIKNIDGVKEKAAKNILAFQEYREIPLSVFLGALNIKSIGETIFQLLAENGIDTLEKIGSVREKQLAKIKGIGPERATMIVEGLKKKNNLIIKLLNHVKVLPYKAPKKKGNKYQDVVFVMTGFRDKGLTEKLISNGATEKGSVAKGVTILMAKDPSSNSSKAKKARELDIEIISQEEALKRFV